MIDMEILAKVEAMADAEKLELIRDAMYSEEHLLKAMYKIMLIVDPGAVDDICAWFKGRVH